MNEDTNIAPLYHQIKEYIVSRIESGEFKPLEQIPAESQLCEKYNVSRITVRRAIDELVKMGLLVKKQGKGTFVNQPKINFFSIDLVSFAERMKQRGFNVTTKVLEIQEQVPPAKVGRELGLEENGEAVKIVRVRSIESDPVSIETSYIPKKLFESGELLEQLYSHLRMGNSLYQFFSSRMDVHITRAHQVFEPIILEEREQETLDCQGNMAGLLIHRTAYNGSMPVEFVKVIHRGDRCKFEMDLNK